MLKAMLGASLSFCLMSFFVYVVALVMSHSKNDIKDQRILTVIHWSKKAGIGLGIAFVCLLVLLYIEYFIAIAVFSLICYLFAGGEGGTSYFPTSNSPSTRPPSSNFCGNGSYGSSSYGSSSSCDPLMNYYKGIGLSNNHAAAAAEQRDLESWNRSKSGF